MYRYCVIDIPDKPSLEAMVADIRAKDQSYINHGGVFNTDSQQQNVAGTQVKLFTMIDEQFPAAVQSAAGFAEYTQAGIMAILATAEWTDPNAEP